MSENYRKHDDSCTKEHRLIGMVKFRGKDTLSDLEEKYGITPATGGNIFVCGGSELVFRITESENSYFMDEPVEGANIYKELIEEKMSTSHPCDSKGNPLVDLEVVE
jgi:hypothetical protein